MFFPPAYAQTAPAGASADPTTAILLQLLPFVLILVIFYFLLIRPQQKRMKQHQEMIAALKKGDTVVTSGGLIGKVDRVEADEVRVELSPGTVVRVVKGTISEVRGRGEPAAANDSSPKS